MAREDVTVSEEWERGRRTGRKSMGSDGEGQRRKETLTETA